MSMTARIWSINAISTELGLDRRTVAKALRNVRPDGVGPGGHKGWFLASVLKALGMGNRPPDNGPEVPPDFAAVHQVESPVDKAMLVALLAMGYTVGALAAAMAVAAGAPLKVAFALQEFVKLSFVQKVEEICETFGLEAAGIFDPDGFDEPNWLFLAAVAKEQVDVGAWQEWKRERQQWVALNL